MKRIESTFKALKKKNESALVGFITSGDPDLDRSLEIVLSMEKNGMDILELGFPFSDPTADGPVIQRSSARALDQKVNLAAVFELTKKIREVVSIPIIYMGYYNPVFKYGLKKFYEDALDAGADGVLIVDLPPEESDEMTTVWKGEDLALIRLIAPTTPLERMKKIAASASGFLYAVTQKGVTGAGDLDIKGVEDRVKQLQTVTDLPICTGFGISTAAQVKVLSCVADGVVIGSAFEQLIEDGLDRTDLADMVGLKTREFKNATKRG